MNLGTLIGYFILVPPEITDFGPQEYTVLSGDPVTLRCQAAGTPLPTVKWQRNSMYSCHVIDGRLLSLDFV